MKKLSCWRPSRSGASGAGVFCDGLLTAVLVVDTEGFGQWVQRLAQRAPRNKVVVAIANKLARIAWAVLSSGRDYRHQPLPQRAAA